VVIYHKGQKLRTREISISLLLAATLSLTGCGGGGSSKIGLNGGGSEPGATDTTAPVFVNDTNITTNLTIDEGAASLVIATLEASDDNGVTFSLSGQDKSFFELTPVQAGSTYSTTLKFKNVPDYEDQPSYDVTVVATDNKGNSNEKTFHVDLIDKPFVFDMISSDIGATQEGTTNSLVLRTREAAGSVTYSFPGAHDYFALNGNIVTFTAPAYRKNGSNTYSTTIQADDTVNTKSIVVTATVTNKPVPPTRVFMITKKIKHKSDGTQMVTTYGYDSDHYLIERNITGGSSAVIPHVTFTYEDSHSIMKGFNADTGELVEMRAFAPGAMDYNSFTPEKRLSLAEHVRFIYREGDSVSYFADKKVTQEISGISYGQSKTTQRIYNANNKLEKYVTGFYQTSPDNKFASAEHNATLNNALVNNNQSVLMAFTPIGITRYLYGSNGLLNGMEYDGNNDGVFEIHDNVYPRLNQETGLIDDIIISGDSPTARLDYSGDGFIQKVTYNNGQDVYNYSYSNNLKKVEIDNGTRVLTTYIFEEE